MTRIGVTRAGAGLLAAQSIIFLVGFGLASRRAVPSDFLIEAGARDGLRQLWAASTSARAERAACLTATTDGDTLRVTRVMPLESTMHDSLAISATASLESCAPPHWQGTVHSHVALRDGQRPYPNFSGADRGVMSMWWQRWNTDGVFCLVFSGDQVHCEIDGVNGLRIYPSGRY